MIPVRDLFLRSALGAFVLAGGTASSSAQEVRWQRLYDTARRESRDKGRPLVIAFGAESCGWCRQMEATTYRDPQVVRMLNDRFIPLAVDGADEHNANLVATLGIGAFPTVVLVAPDGKVIQSLEGYRDAARFRAELQRAVEETRRKDTATRSGPARPRRTAVAARG